MSNSLIQGSYIIAGLAFILALAGLSKHHTAKRGNIFGMVGMAVALVFTVLGTVLAVKSDDLVLFEAAPRWAVVAILVPMAIGAVVGIVLAVRVEMTGMPELIALLHSFVGLTAVLVG
jgi:NAD(P) transhydrogenase subunit beta